MLILGRKEGGRIEIEATAPGKLVLEVVEIKGRQVRLGFDGPRHLRVIRQELPRTGQPAQGPGKELAAQPAGMRGEKP